VVIVSTSFQLFSWIMLLSCIKSSLICVLDAESTILATDIGSID
jgi:hypothetical protein